MLKSSLVFLVLSFSLLFSEDVIEIKSNGYINWSEGVAVAKGMGFSRKSFNPNLTIQKAKRAAKLDAMRNLLELVGNVKVDSTSTIQDKMLEDEKIKTTISGLISNIVDVKYKQIDESSVEAELKIKLDDTVYNTAIKSSKSTQDFKGTKGTGLIIDARGIDFIPTLSPKIIEEYSGVLYPDGVLIVDNLKGRFSVIYLNNIEDAKTHPIVGEYPLEVKAKSIYEGKNDQIVLNKESSAKIAENLKIDALQEGKVIIVIK